MQEKRLSRILGIYRSNPSGSVLKVWKSYPESFYKKLVNKRFFLKIRDNPTFGITNFFSVIFTLEQRLTYIPFKNCLIRLFNPEKPFVFDKDLDMIKIDFPL